MWIALGKGWSRYSVVFPNTWKSSNCSVESSLHVIVCRSGKGCFIPDCDTTWNSAFGCLARIMVIIWMKYSLGWMEQRVSNLFMRRWWTTTFVRFGRNTSSRSNLGVLKYTCLKTPRCSTYLLDTLPSHVKIVFGVPIGMGVEKVTRVFENENGRWGTASLVRIGYSMARYYSWYILNRHQAC